MQAERRFVSRRALAVRLRDELNRVPAKPVSSEPPPRASVIRLTPVAPDTTALVEAVRSGQAHATVAIWRQYAPLIRAVLQRSLGPEAEVDDATQETFVRFFRNLDALREPSALRSFLIGIAMRVAASELRRRHVRRWLSLTPRGEVPDVEATATDHEAREVLARLYAILDRIPDRERLCFVLRHFQELDLTEVAAALSVSLATAKRVLARADDRVLSLAARDPRLTEYFTRRHHDVPTT
jgi:RNA polymerase sigma-70 factor (ECF subfamily)